MHFKLAHPGAHIRYVELTWYDPHYGVPGMVDAGSVRCTRDEEVISITIVELVMVAAGSPF